MKEFVVYTGLRIALFVASLGLVVGIWALAADGRVNILGALVAAFLLSGIASYFLLARQRDAFARRVEERASRATQAFEERKAREDRAGEV
ncbi:MAG: hypothetical protein AVDCRST_MAG32-2413 [uncultured Nocardioides sp.]|uniref:DUF4229 domain-containing protein n=1 Tax=uncultured Nocardioides sp. TaxID=198441 RepID=A0A6J4NU42_9ACTN|nr:MAG: hypothetical protein AVDCRST_MAG32-2413 [uncultured Nocardioides sp.]